MLKASQPKQAQQRQKMQNERKRYSSDDASPSSPSRRIIAIASFSLVLTVLSRSTTATSCNVNAFMVGPYQRPHRHYPMITPKRRSPQLSWLPVSALYTASSDDTAAGDDHDEGSAEEEEEAARKKRKRDKIKDFFGPAARAAASSSSPKVEPIPLTDAQEEALQQDEQQQQQPRRVKAKFDTLFQGMPKIDEILSGSSASEETADNDDAAAAKDSSDNNIPQLDPEELQAIEEKFEKLKAEAKARLQTDAPEGIVIDDIECPTDDNDGNDNDLTSAECMVDKIMEEQKRREIKSLSEKKAQLSFDEYEQQMMKSISERASQSDAETNNIVRDIVEEAELETEEKELDAQEASSFAEYEAQKKKDAEKAAATRASQLQLESFLKKNQGENMDVDEITLQLMKGLSKESADKLDVEIQEIQQYLDSKKRQEQMIQPETMKEWQMMRSIASKMSKDAAKAAAVKAAEEDREDVVDWFEDEIEKEEEEAPIDQEDLAEKLRLWKEYQEKDAEMRKKAGLTVEVRMPFEWMDAAAAADDGEESQSEQITSNEGEVIENPYEVRDELDRQSLQALKDLLEKRKGMVGSERLEAQIEALEASIAAKKEGRLEEEKLWAQKKEEEEAKKKATPVDVSSVFGFSPTKNTKETTVVAPPPDEISEPEKDDLPDTAFFNDDVGQYEEDSSATLTPPPPPDTPFFSDTFDEDDLEPADKEAKDDDDDEVNIAQQSLGSMEEQKFRKIAAGAGVRSDDEEAELKRKWEEFQQAEQRMRDATGLSESGDGTANVDLDLSDVTLESGDVDADKVLASLGPRPTKKPKEEDSYQQFVEYGEQARLQKSMEEAEQQAGNSGVVAESENVEMTSEEEQDGEEEGEEEDIIINHGHATKLDPSDVSEQLYRPIAATGGGKFKDDLAAKENDKAAYEELIRKEEEMRKKIESEEIAASGNVADDVISQMDINDEDSVEDLLSQLGNRPKVQKRKSSSGSFLGMDDDLDLSSGKDTKKKKRKPSSSIYEQMPDWLRREQAERRREEFETDEDYDDDEDEEYEYEEDVIDYEEQERQAAEFERSRSAKKEVNIADIFGRDYFGPDDFGDDYTMTKGEDSTFSSFNTRKETLLEYEQLSVWDLNTLMEHKSSIDSASKYLKRINKPYREFGGIFRLEGCLVDLTGLHWQAWKKTAEAFEFDKPDINDVKLASLTRAETAVQKVFYWTDDIFFAREIAKTQRSALKECFDQWMEEENITVPSYNGTSPSVEENVNEQEITSNDGDTFGVNPTESDLLAMQTEAWGKAASMYGFVVPSLESMQLATLLSPEEAISKAFNLSVDAIQLAGMVSTYRAAMKEATDAWMKKNNKEAYSDLKKQSGENSSPSGTSEAGDQNLNDEPIIDESVMLEIQVFAWTKAAEKYGFESPSLEEVQLASWVSTEEAVRDILKWTRDEEKISEITTAHRDGMKEISAKYIKKYNLKQKTESEVAETPAPNAVPDAPVKPERNGAQVETVASRPAQPTEADIMRIQFESWVKVAEDFGFNPPTVDEVQLATFVSPPEAVQRVFKWSNDEAECQKIALTHRELLKEASRKLMESFNAESLSMNDNTSSDDTQAEDNLPLFTLHWGAIEWLTAMEDVEMPCAIMSNLEREQLDVILEQTGLAPFFPPERRVSSSNGYENESQEMLGGALRVERRPDHCIVFDTTPAAAVAAHDADMKIISMIGYYPKFELITADKTARYFSDLNTVHLRNLFSERVYDEPLVDLQPLQPDTKKAPKTRFWEEGDRG